MPRYEPQRPGSRRRRLTAEERAAVGSARRVVDPQGRRWIVRHETGDVVLNSWGVVFDLLAPLLWWRYAKKHGATAVYADCADGSSHRIGLGLHDSVHETMDRVAAAIEAGEELPAGIER
jgi:hypothetical protein